MTIVRISHLKCKLLFNRKTDKYDCNWLREYRFRKNNFGTVKNRNASLFPFAHLRKLRSSSINKKVN